MNGQRARWILETSGGGARGEWRERIIAWWLTIIGIKQNILRLLVDHHCDVTVVPARTSAEDVLALKPDGVFLSNGPGDPEPIDYAIENIRKLLGRVPIFGICLGHQLCGLALGGKTFKLKFGHHGSNHPVKNLLTEKVEITAQNHGFCVDPESLPSSDVEITHVNLNDHTNEGMRHRSLPLFSVQYHPEASPGPHDARYLFDEFVEHDAENRRQAATELADYMPKRTDIKKILIIGSGPIVIGQACEFDYSGTQACKALRSEGYEVVLVNSNPATIMTDPEIADRTYIEPLTKEYLEAIIARERPDALVADGGRPDGIESGGGAGRELGFLRSTA